MTQASPAIGHAGGLASAALVSEEVELGRRLEELERPAAAARRGVGAAIGMSGEIADAALDYARRGRPVFPLRPRSKLPATPNGCKDAKADAAPWSRCPDFNIGLATGGGLVVLDVDDADSLHDLEQRYEQLPETVCAETGRGGEHYYFRSSQPIGCSAGKLGPGLDIRGEGGYVVAPPSIHENGRRYEWINPPGEVHVAQFPEWLGVLLAPSSAQGKAQPSSTWQTLAGGVGEGQRNAAAAKLYGYLLARRVDAVLARELLVAWDAKRNRPPLGREELERVCESIAGRERRKRV